MRETEKTLQLEREEGYLKNLTIFLDSKQKELSECQRYIDRVNIEIVGYKERIERLKQEIVEEKRQRVKEHYQ